MPPFFTQNKYKYYEHLLFFTTRGNTFEHLSRSLLAWLGWAEGTQPETPQQLVNSDDWDDIQKQSINPIPRSRVITLYKRDGKSVEVSLLHYVLEDRQLFFVAPSATKEQRSDLRELFDFVNHETRTPINSLFGLIELLAQTQLTDDQRQYVDAMHTLADTLMHLLSDALDTSRISAGKLELKPEIFNLYKVVERIVHRNQLLHPNLSVSFTYNESLPKEIYADEHRIEQVIINIISNALKHTTEGSVQLHVQPGAAPQTIAIQIADTGQGIAPDVLKRLFIPYERAEANFTMGSGLGLYISKQIVELHKGTIAVESQLGVGTTVTITFPLCEKQPTLPLEQTTEEKPLYEPYNGKYILLVDDNAINVMVVQKFLKRWGYLADVAYSGKEALECVEQKDYVLILMDLRMPEMDGFQATQYIRARTDAKAQTPIVALTASTEPGVRERIEEEKMNGFLFKPFNAEELHHTVATFAGWSDQLQEG